MVKHFGSTSGSAFHIPGRRHNDHGRFADHHQLANSSSEKKGAVGQGGPQRAGDGVERMVDSRVGGRVELADSRRTATVRETKFGRSREGR
jgi:hypothetical protein